MIQSLYLGRVGYDEALRLQAELVELRHQGRIGNVLLLLEHPPVLTLGRNAHRSNILASDALLASRGVTVHEIKRGGDVTYHGPGQLVGYPIFDLRSLSSAAACRPGFRIGPVDFVRQLEEILIRLCNVYRVRAGRISGLTGVWCGLSDGPDSPSEEIIKPSGQTASNREPMKPGRKIGAIGIHVSRGITSHGFAFNVTTNLSDFELINPCGITDHAVTSLARESKESLPALDSIADQTARLFGQVLGENVLAVESVDTLLAAVQTGVASHPAEDIPLTIPADVRRLHHEGEPPIRV